MRKVGDGMNTYTRFWLDRWKGEASLRVLFPRLFEILNQKESLVGEVWNPSLNGGVWDLSWH